MWERPLLLYCSLSTIPVHLFFEYSNFLLDRLLLCLLVLKHIEPGSTLRFTSILFSSCSISSLESLCTLTFVETIPIFFIKSFIFIWWDSRGPFNLIRTCFFIWMIFLWWSEFKHSSEFPPLYLLFLNLLSKALAVQVLVSLMLFLTEGTETSSIFIVVLY